VGAGFVVGKDVKVCVAKTTLRTWNPGVDAKRVRSLEVQSVPPNANGLQRPAHRHDGTNMLEGFRKGRIVRVFGPGWKHRINSTARASWATVTDACSTASWSKRAQEIRSSFPFRTDYGNQDDLPWFQLKPGEAPRPSRALIGR